MKPIKLLLILFILLFSADHVMGQKLRHRVFMSQHRFARPGRMGMDWREGMVNIPEIGFGYGLAATTIPMSKWEASLTNVTGYQFMRNLKAGIGYGVQIYPDGVLIPLYFDTRVNMNGRMIVPFASLAAGASLSPDDFKNNTRVFVNPAIGLRYVVKNNVSANLSVGLMVSEGNNSRASFANVKLGMEFKGKRQRF